jgi:hypothetical protein
MTLARWLDARRPAPPAALRARIDTALGSQLYEDAQDPAETFLAAAERLVRTLLDENVTSRGSALDLLAADALVTYAFEALSERPTDLARRAAEAMTRIAALAHGPDARAGLSEAER